MAIVPGICCGVTAASGLAAWVGSLYVCCCAFNSAIWSSRSFLEAGSLTFTKDACDAAISLAAALGLLSDGRPEPARGLPTGPVTRRTSVALVLNTGLPLALLDSERPSFPAQKVMDPTWYPCVLTDTSFRADCLATRDAARHAKAWPELHRDVLAKQVNQAARPLPAAQWFTRSSDGSGVGMEGLRVDAGQLGRRLNKSDFPELLLDEVWKEQTEAELVREYHAWQAPSLLAHSGLSQFTRMRLEQAACRSPAKLLEIYRLIPKFVDEQAIQVALVAARLERAS